MTSFACDVTCLCLLLQFPTKRSIGSKKVKNKAPPDPIPTYVVHEEDNDIRRLRCQPTKTVTMEIGFVFFKSNYSTLPLFLKEKKKNVFTPLLCVKETIIFQKQKTFRYFGPYSSKKVNKSRDEWKNGRNGVPKWRLPMLWAIKDTQMGGGTQPMLRR